MQRTTQPFDWTKTIGCLFAGMVIKREKKKFSAGLEIKIGISTYFYVHFQEKWSKLKLFTKEFTTLLFGHVANVNIDI